MQILFFGRALKKGKVLLRFWCILLSCVFADHGLPPYKYMHLAFTLSPTHNLHNMCENVHFCLENENCCCLMTRHRCVIVIVQVRRPHCSCCCPATCTTSQGGGQWWGRQVIQVRKQRLRGGVPSRPVFCCPDLLQ